MTWELGENNFCSTLQLKTYRLSTHSQQNKILRKKFNTCWNCFSSVHSKLLLFNKLHLLIQERDCILESILTIESFPFEFISSAFTSNIAYIIVKKIQTITTITKKNKFKFYLNKQNKNNFNKLKRIKIF